MVVLQQFFFLATIQEFLLEIYREFLKLRNTFGIFGDGIISNSNMTTAMKPIKTNVFDASEVAASVAKQSSPKRLKEFWRVSWEDPDEAPEVFRRLSGSFTSYSQRFLSILTYFLEQDCVVSGGLSC